MLSGPNWTSNFFNSAVFEVSASPSGVLMTLRTLGVRIAQLSLGLKCVLNRDDIFLFQNTDAALFFKNS